MSTVHCPSCHRRERWDNGQREVESPGGARVPAGHPELAAWRTLRAALQGESAPVVGRCPACDQPMIGEATAVPWTIHTPEGDLVVDGVLTGPKGKMTVDEANFWVEEQLRERIEVKPGLWLFQASVMSTMLVPIGLWVFALVCFLTFIVNFGRGS